MSIAAIVLAGGSSSRFGADKLATPLDGKPLLHHALAAVAGVAERMVLVLAPAARVPALPADLTARIVIARDPLPGAGPLAGLVAGLEAAGDADVALVVGGDMPTLEPGVLRLLARALVDDPGRAAISLEAQPPAPLPMALRPRPVAPVARRMLGDERRSLHRLLGELAAARLPAATWRVLDPAGRTLHDVDEPADLAGD
jgi:molybdopterin-guanine dinucleotide biosynthesis protein A